MITLNLANPNESEIKYKISKFPDGQQQVFVEKESLMLGGTRYSTMYSYCQISSRLNNFKDLELIICATKSLRNLGVDEIHLYAPYFLGSRSDIKFEDGSNNYLKDVICPIINSLKFESVTVLDPHSIALENCITNFKKIDNLELVKWALNDSKVGIFPKEIEYYAYVDEKKIFETTDNFILISPDAGANKKIYKIAEQIGYIGGIITCAKIRDVNGKITHTDVPIQGDVKDKPFVVIDDICDGGKTFTEIANRIRKLYPDNKIYLIVTHGIFSKGFTDLSNLFDGVYCTNSYSNIDESKVMYESAGKLSVKQLNIF